MTSDALRARFPDPRDWVVTRVRNDFRRVSVRHGGATTEAAWIASLCGHWPAIRLRSPAELLLEVRRSGGIELGLLSGREAHRLVETLQSCGFEVRVEDASSVSYFPRVGGVEHVIEDDAEGFCLSLIRGGAMVEEEES
jgi:hypothetical protein